MVFLVVFVIGGIARPVVFDMNKAALEIARNLLLLFSYFVVWMLLGFGITGDGFWPVFGGVFTSAMVYFDVFNRKVWLLITWLITAAVYGFIHFLSLKEPFLQFNHFAFALELPILTMVLFQLMEFILLRRSQKNTPNHGQ
jgi:hypothetical protein